MTGLLNLVSLGPGAPDQITAAAMTALADSQTIVGYELYLRAIDDTIKNKEIISLPLTQERDRAAIALSKAREGKKVALVSSGDIGVYAMATLAFEQLTEDDTIAIRVFPGVTAANACASLLGAPLSHDFATLSLSDLLCPWSWIEQRARRIAQADLCVCLYNVQSRNRQEGVYRILEIMLEHKSPETLCGIVRNAYRQEQSTKVCTLQELPEQKFDMFTSLVIGNRFTARKQDWIYTPRGYSSWCESAGSDTPMVEARQALPDQAIWLFSGTGDGNALAGVLLADGERLVISAATEYGGETAVRACPDAHVISGHLGSLKRAQLMKESRCTMIIDATHPHAAEMSRQLIELSARLAIPYLRYERGSLAIDPTACLTCQSAQEASALAMANGSSIFLSTGTKNLREILESKGAEKKNWFVRVAPDEQSIRTALACKIPRANIFAMQGPFSREMNLALWRTWQIDCVVTKESGVGAGVEQKIEAAKELNIPVIVIKRPIVSYPAVAFTSQEVLTEIKTRRSEWLANCR